MLTRHPSEADLHGLVEPADVSAQILDALVTADTAVELEDFTSFESFLLEKRDQVSQILLRYPRASEYPLLVRQPEGLVIHHTTDDAAGRGRNESGSQCSIGMANS
jgi:hypothetical protein